MEMDYVQEKISEVEQKAQEKEAALFVKYMTYANHYLSLMEDEIKKNHSAPNAYCSEYYGKAYGLLFAASYLAVAEWNEQFTQFSERLRVYDKIWGISSDGTVKTIGN